jgi:hypothetical protein
LKLPRRKFLRLAAGAAALPAVSRIASICATPVAIGTHCGLGHFMPMPIYHFTVHESDRYDDPEGTELPDDSAARHEAILILRDLDKSHQTGKRAWTIDVTEGDRKVATIIWPAESDSR